MKKSIYGIILAIIVVLAIIIVTFTEGRNIKETNLDDSLSVAVENSIENVTTRQTYTIEDNEEFIADFSEELLNNVTLGELGYEDKNFSITIDVAGVDYQKKMLSVIVVETYSDTDGQMKEASYTATVLLDQPDYVDGCTITYYYSDGVTVYKQYNRTKGSAFPEITTVPTSTSDMYGFTFKYWSDTSGNKVSSFPSTVEKDSYEYIACGDVSTSRATI